MGDGANAALASAYAAVMVAGQRPQDPTAYRQASQALRVLGGTTVKFGLREIPASELATEAELLAEELEIIVLRPSTPDQYRQKASALQDLSLKFRNQVGDRVLILPELFHRGTVKGSAKALPLAAQAEEALGEALVQTDPKSAAEHYQMARLWWAQAGIDGAASSAAARVAAYSRAAKCWFCGREISGEGVHFVSMPSDLSEVLRRSGGDSVLPTHPPSGNEVYACRGCYSALYKLADQLALQRTSELEARIQAQLEEIRREIGSLRTALASIRR